MKLLGELNLSFDLCMRPTELADGLKLAKLCPETRFVLDHCGNAAPAAFLPEAQRGGKPAAHDPKSWRNDIKALADCPNVICKISGVIASAPQGVPFTESLGPIVNHCLDTFGPDRVVFGGDWPVCLLGGSYKDWLDHPPHTHFQPSPRTPAKAPARKRTPLLSAPGTCRQTELRALPNAHSVPLSVLQATPRDR
ncbi:MAG UNVERIFIED_CONTAM: amidohydrolase family protein [Planctomycetaceae bacterium]